MTPRLGAHGTRARHIGRVLRLLASWLIAAGAVPAAAQVTRGPYLQSVSSSSVTLCWRTSGATPSTLAYGGAPGAYAFSITDTANVANHEVTIGGLLPAHAYAYGVGTPTGLLTPADATYAFRTAPAPGASVPVRVWVVGDSGHDNAQSEAVRDRFEAWSAARPPDLWLMLGDNAYSAGTDTDYQSGCFGLYALEMRRWPLFPTRGNHDVLYAGAWNDYLEFFALPSAGQCGGVPSGSESYYSFDWGRVHFICLDSEGSDRTLGGPMIQWLRQDVAATAASWVICYWHHPPYSHGSHNSDDPADSEGKMTDMRTRVLPILDSTGVDLVLCGHSHSYERSFLLNGHYGLSSTLTAAMRVGPGDGRPGSDGPYLKPHAGKTPFEGAVYTVAGSSSEAKAVSPMPCMVASLSVMGSMVVNIDGNRLDARFLDLNGAVQDSFAIVKGNGLNGAPPRVSSLRLAPPRPNPAHGAVGMDLELPATGRATLDVLDAAGRRVARLIAGVEPAGPRHVEWRAVSGGRPAAVGLYWAVLTAAGETRVRRIVLAP